MRHDLDDAPAASPTVVFATYGGCAPLRPLHLPDVDGNACDKFLDFALEAAQDRRIKTVVFGAFGEAYFGREFQHSSQSPSLDPASPAAAPIVAAFAESIRALRKEGKRVFVILSNPTSPAFDPKQMMSRYTGDVHHDTVNREAFVSAVEPVISRIEQAARLGGAIIVDPVDGLCSDRECPVIGSDGRPLYKDRHHLRSSVVEQRAAFIDQLLRR